jgi:hypothetical protein
MGASQTLDQKLGDKAPPDYRRLCGGRSARFYSTRFVNHPTGIVAENWTCEACKGGDMRTTKGASPRRNAATISPMPATSPYHRYLL